MEFQAAVAKVSKYSVRDSGDSVEVTERPHGGLSLVLADGQRSGRSAKLISNIVARKAASLLGEGVRDGAVARAAHDYLRTHRSGQVSADLIILSLDLVSRTLVVSRNGPPVLLWLPVEGGKVLDGLCEPVGIHAGTKPVIVEVPLEVGLRAVAFSDGLLDAGVRRGAHQSTAQWLDLVRQHASCGAEELADLLLARAIELDEERPQDDITVLVAGVYSRQDAVAARRLTLRVPVDLVAGG